MLNVNEYCEKIISEDEVIALRRYFHMHPELSNCEFGTMEKICSLLDEWDIPFKKNIGGTGVIARLIGNRPGKEIALRADMDALPITEKNTELPYCSQNPGVMHACGHDTHVAILLACAKIFRSLNGDFPGAVRFFFQPDEENTGGAKRLIAEGCLENPRVDHVIGLHVYPDLPAGQIGIRYGKMYAASDPLTLRIYGKSTHGAMPHQGVDAVVIAANVISALQTVVSRNTNPMDSVVLTFGTIHGGNAKNIVSEFVECGGIVRCLDPESRERIRKQVRTIAENVALGMGGRAEVEFVASYDPLITDETVTDRIRLNAETLFGKQNVIFEDAPRLTVEDFSYYASARPCGFFHLGCANVNAPHTPLHNSSFNIDESCIMKGVKLQILNTLTLLES